MKEKVTTDSGSHTRLSISGVSLMDIAQLHAFKDHMQSGHNAIVFNLQGLDYSIVD